MRRLLAFAGVVAPLVLAAPLGGCDANPFCLNCGSADGGGTDSLPGGLDLLADLTEVDLSPEPPDLRGDGGEAGTCTPQQLQSDPRNCGVCGRECLYPRAAGLCQAGKCVMGPCQPGYSDLNKDPKDGCEYACIPTTPSTEVCDGADNDCNGKVDDNFNLQTDPNNCGACGVACSFPSGNGSCAAGRCTLSGCASGYADVDKNAFNGCEYKCPVFPAGVEMCNGKDDDCNGQIDDNAKDVGQPCDSACPLPNPCVKAGTCTFKTSTCNGQCCGVCTIGKMACIGGAPACQAGDGPRLEVCNGQDDNCDGQIDEGFDLQKDPLNCGACGNRCNVGNAVASCSAGRCAILTCKPGFADLNKSPGDGCEYTCPVNPPTAESCNGKDDDCNGQTDDNLTTPGNFCSQTSICLGAKVSCGGAKGWICNYQAVNPNIEVDANGNLAVAERLCDNIDGNCNTQVDETFANKGKQCSAGVGACQGTATFVCSNDRSTTTCPATADPNKAVDEKCNGVDDNCDGQIDERAPRAGTTCYNGGPHACKGWTDAMVQVGNLWIYAYEASRPGAGPTAAGTESGRACSVANVQPWAPVDYMAATAACAAIKDSTGAAMRLCTAPEWTAACNVGIANQPVWSYSANPTVYSQTTCNGVDTGINKPWSTGSGPSCYAAQGGGRIYDMSGNVAEWTSTQVSSNNKTYYKVRGGSYNNQSLGTNCNFDFTIEQPTYQFSNLGFRCCANNAP